MMDQRRLENRSPVTRHDRLPWLRWSWSTYAHLDDHRPHADPPAGHRRRERGRAA